MGRVKTHPHNYAVDTETFQEILYIYSRRGETALGVAVTQELLNLQPAIISITIAEIRAAIRLLQNIPGIAPRAESDANIYILPDHQFRAVDAMLTDFHLPRYAADAGNLRRSRPPPLPLLQLRRCYVDCVALFW